MIHPLPQLQKALQSNEGIAIECHDNDAIQLRQMQQYGNGTQPPLP